MPDIFDSKNPTTEEKKPTPLATNPPETLHPWSEKHRDQIDLLKQPNGKPGLFATFTIKPTGMRFENQENQEEILLLLRKHFVTNVPWIFFSLLLFIFPILFTQFIQSTFPLLLLPLLSGEFLFILTLLYYLIVFGFVLTQFATWFYHVGIITNIRLVDVDFYSLLSRSIAMTDITDIVDTEAHQKGIAASIFNYGDVGVQTAGTRANIEFSSIPQPNKVVDMLSDLMRSRRNHV